MSPRELANSAPFAKRHLNFIASLALFVLVFLTYYFTGRGATKFDYFVPLANGFLHGRLSIVNPSPVLLNDELVRGAYVIYPPMPAIVLLPAVAIWRLQVNQAVASALFGGVNTSLVFLLAKQFTDSFRLRLWIAVLFGFGTIHWWLASIGSAWYFSQIISFFFLTLAIISVLMNRSPFLVGLLLGASYWTRLTTILAFPFFVIMLSERWREKSNNLPLARRARFTMLLEFTSGAAIFIVANSMYNYLRFSTVRDIAYSIQARNEPRWYPNGLFDISYIPDHLKILFLRLPVFTVQPPFVKPSMLGLSILITTPAFVYCLRAGINRIVLACWSAVVPIAAADFSHGGTGWAQFGYRFGMDFYPFLIVLTALGMTATVRKDGRLTRMQRLLIGMSVLVNLWGVLWINKFGWANDVVLKP